MLILPWRLTISVLSLQLLLFSVVNARFHDETTLLNAINKSIHFKPFYDLDIVSEISDKFTLIKPLINTKDTIRQYNLRGSFATSIVDIYNGNRCVLLLKQFLVSVRDIVSAPLNHVLQERKDISEEVKDSSNEGLDSVSNISDDDDDDDEIFWDDNHEEEEEEISIDSPRVKKTNNVTIQDVLDEQSDDIDLQTTRLVAMMQHVGQYQDEFSDIGGGNYTISGQISGDDNHMEDKQDEHDM